jgi:hypothetical protein
MPYVPRPTSGDVSNLFQLQAGNAEKAIEQNSVSRILWFEADCISPFVKVHMQVLELQTSNEQTMVNEAKANADMMKNVG